MSMLRVLVPWATVLLAGCTAFAHPIVGEDATTLDERLIGRWEGPFDEDEKIRVVVRRNGRMTVTFIAPESKPETEAARWITANVDGLAIANVAFVADGQVYWKPVRYEVADPGKLRIFPCNEETWSGAVRSGALAGRAQTGLHGPSTFVSASVAELRDFVRANRDAAFVDDPLVFQRNR